MTLIERWRELNEEAIIREIQMLFAHYSNAIRLFTMDENEKMIQYCVDHRGDNEIDTYGKKIGICYSQEIALECIQQILIDYAFLLIPFFVGDLPTLDFGVQNLPQPIGFYQNNYGAETEIRDAIFVFEKCKNHIGFNISKIIPLI